MQGERYDENNIEHLRRATQSKLRRIDGILRDMEKQQKRSGRWLTGALFGAAVIAVLMKDYGYETFVPLLLYTAFSVIVWNFSAHHTLGTDRDRVVAAIMRYDNDHLPLASD